MVTGGGGIEVEDGGANVITGDSVGLCICVGVRINIVTDGVDADGVNMITGISVGINIGTWGVGVDVDDGDVNIVTGFGAVGLDNRMAETMTAGGGVGEDIANGSTGVGPNIVPGVGVGGNIANGSTGKGPPHS